MVYGNMTYIEQKTEFSDFGRLLDMRPETIASTVISAGSIALGVETRREQLQASELLGKLPREIEATVVSFKEAPKLRLILQPSFDPNN